MVALLLAFLCIMLQCCTVVLRLTVLAQTMTWPFCSSTAPNPRALASACGLKLGELWSNTLCRSLKGHSQDAA